MQRRAPGAAFRRDALAGGGGGAVRRWRRGRPAGVDGWALGSWLPCRAALRPVRRLGTRAGRQSARPGPNCRRSIPATAWIPVTSHRAPSVLLRPLDLRPVACRDRPALNSCGRTPLGRSGVLEYRSAMFGAGSCVIVGALVCLGPRWFAVGLSKVGQPFSVPVQSFALCYLPSMVWLGSFRCFIPCLPSFPFHLLSTSVCPSTDPALSFISYSYSVPLSYSPVFFHSTSPILALVSIVRLSPPPCYVAQGLAISTLAAQVDSPAAVSSRAAGSSAPGCSSSGSSGRLGPGLCPSSAAGCRTISHNSWPP